MLRKTQKILIKTKKRIYVKYGTGVHLGILRDMAGSRSN